jgi:hypothetical protein
VDKYNISPHIKFFLEAVKMYMRHAKRQAWAKCVGLANKNPKAGSPYFVAINLNLRRFSIAQLGSRETRLLKRLANLSDV